MKITAVIPAYNEQETTKEVVEQAKPKVTEVILVDDGSTDQTALLAKAAGAEVVSHFLNRGQGAALQTGIKLALKRGADIILTFDADGQHQVEDIEKVVKPILLGEFEVVLGSRFLERSSKIPWVKLIVLKLAVIFTRLTTGLKITDTHNGFRGFSRRAAELINITQDGMAHASEIIAEIKRHKLRFKEAPVKILYTPYSEKKGQSIFASFQILLDLFLGKLNK